MWFQFHQLQIKQNKPISWNHLACNTQDFCLIFNTHSFVNVNILSVKHSVKMLLIFVRILVIHFYVIWQNILFVSSLTHFFTISQILFRKICHKRIRNLRNMLFSIPESLDYEWKQILKFYKRTLNI